MKKVEGYLELEVVTKILSKELTTLSSMLNKSSLSNLEKEWVEERFKAIGLNLTQITEFVPELIRGLIDPEKKLLQMTRNVFDSDCTAPELHLMNHDVIIADEQEAEKLLSANYAKVI